MSTLDNRRIWQNNNGLQAFMNTNNLATTIIKGFILLVDGLVAFAIFTGNPELINKITVCGKTDPGDV
jgi:hypothetical protein